MRTQKTGTTITIKFPDSQIVIISASPTGKETFIANENGRPFAKESFGNWFRARCTETHIDKNAHGIRKLPAL